jgi:outer membrane biosynthesis protein TonB
MRSGLIFVASVFVAAFVVFLLAVTQFTSDPLVWTARHLGYAAAALVPVIPIAVLARWTWRRAPRAEQGEADTDVADDDAAAPAGPVPESAPTVAALLSRAAPAPAEPKPTVSIPVRSVANPPKPRSKPKPKPEPKPKPTPPEPEPEPEPEPAAPLPPPEPAAPSEPEPEPEPARPKGASATSDRQFQSVEQLAVASVLERGRSVADVAKTLKVRQATVEMWVARARE